MTDFGCGDFARCGLTLFTIRNGRFSPKPDPLAKDYCEKLLLMGENQVTPMHFHWNKMEDIINRGGGRMVIQLYQANRQERLDARKTVTMSIDGIRTRVPAGGKVVLRPGQSITLPPYLYHTFWAQKGHGRPGRRGQPRQRRRPRQPLPRRAATVPGHRGRQGEGVSAVYGVSGVRRDFRFSI